MAHATASEAADIDESGIEDDFGAAADRVAQAVTERHPAFTDSLKLQFYGLYKQATAGPCTDKRPGIWNPAGRAKWDAWHSLGALPQRDAQRQYVQLLASTLPDWARGTGPGPGAEAGGGAEGTRPRKQAGGGFGPVFSMFASLENGHREVPSDQGAHPSIHEIAGGGDEAAVSSLLSSGCDVDARDGEGCTPLHFAADRGHSGIASLLLAAGATVDALDADGATPLHYASLCGHKEVAVVLLGAGADPQIRDSSGCTAQEVGPSGWTIWPG